MIFENSFWISFIGEAGKGKKRRLLLTCTVALLLFAWEKGNFPFPSGFPLRGRLF
jgi:hypothetical protein